MHYHTLKNNTKDERERKSNRWVTAPAGQFNFQTTSYHKRISLPTGFFLSLAIMC